MSVKIVNVILSHQPRAKVDRMVEHWRTLFPNIDLIVAYGGERKVFDSIQAVTKVYIDDVRLRTIDHQRECQSYDGVFREVSNTIKNKGYDYVYFTEFDHVPLVKDLHSLLLNQMNREGADILFYHLKRVDASSNAHATYHSSKKGYNCFIKNISVREDLTVMLTALGFGQFWKRECFDEVSKLEDDIGIYLEVWMPTMAHHLGYRVRGMREQDSYNQYYGNLSNEEIKEYAKSGAWTVHPVKDKW